MNTSIAIKGRIGMMTLALAFASLPSAAFAAVKIKASASGRVLTIVGDRAGNDVRVAVTPEADAIVVAADGQILGGFVAGSIEQIRLRLGGGSDSLSVELASGGRLGLRMLSVNLGGGDDYATLAVDPGVIRSVSGGPGDDTVSGSGSTADFRSVEHVVSWVALVSNGGGGSLDYSCGIDEFGNRYCQCSKANGGWDCWDMLWDRCVINDKTIEDLRKCLAGTVTTHCTCAQALVGSGPIFRLPESDLVFATR